jgi:hypothetical protein
VQVAQFSSVTDDAESTAFTNPLACRVRAEALTETALDVPVAALPIFPESEDRITFAAAA